MVLLNELLGILRQGQSRKMVDDVIIWAGNNPSRFKLLTDVLIGNYEQNVRDRASWALSYIAESHPELLKNHWKTFVSLLSNQFTSSPIKRNLIRFMQLVDIPEIHHAAIMDRCFQLMNDPKQDIAVRVFSMTVLCNLCEIYPDIINELKLGIQELLPHASAATINRANKILNKIDKI